MTAYSKRAKGLTPTTKNRKDGASGRRTGRRDESAEFEALGFERWDWNKWAYGPFRLVPGWSGLTWGWVAIKDDHQIPIGEASPRQIKELLDNYEDSLVANLPQTYVHQSPGMIVGAEVGSG